MKLTELIAIAHNAYPLGLTMSFNPQTGQPTPFQAGDTLADFIVLELAETFDPDEFTENQLGEALRVIEAAESDLACVSRALRKAYYDLE